MKIISDKKELIKLLKKEHNSGFVPTMGAIHSGHIALVNKSISMCNITIVSIFVNKPQFNRSVDFIKYPRRLKKDISILRKNKVDYLFLPTDRDVYPKGASKKISIHPFKNKLCGRYRRGHFEAVVDVVNRFIKIIKPRKIFLGEKDFQQLLLIENFFKKNKILTKVIRCKTIREKNGLAFSSRNILLTKRQKKIASKVYNILVKKKRNLINTKIQFNFVRKEILKAGVSKIDYLQLIDINKIIYPFKKYNKFKIFIAYYLKSTRLIDNI